MVKKRGQGTSKLSTVPDNFEKVAKSVPKASRVSKDAASQGSKKKPKKTKHLVSELTQSTISDDLLSPELDDAATHGMTASEKFGLPEWQSPCSYFFQQQGSMDFQSYLRLKREEKYSGVQYAAARKIQALWRGFITRFKMKILHLAAQKIQAFIRGFLARRRVGKILKEKAEILYQKQLNEAATKIQAGWRGFHSRQTKLDFAEYKKIQEKNKALKKSIEKINKLESALVQNNAAKKSDPSPETSSSSSALDMAAAAAEEEDQGQQDPAKKSVAKPPADAVHKTSTALQEVEDLLRDSFPDLANSMSDSRVAELYAYATSTMEDSRRRSSYDSPTAKARRGWDGKDIPPKRTSQKKLLLLEKPRTGDSVDDLFPDLPSKDGLVKPDPVKVESLKHAIRLLRQRIQTREVSELQKLHYLLRTTVQPGVHSDIYCNELTEFEKQLKSVKYWTAPPDPRLKKKGNGSLEQKGQDFVSLYSEENETPRIPKSSTGGRSTTDDEGAVSSTAFETDTTVTTGFEATDDYDVYQNQIRAA